MTITVPATPEQDSCGAIRSASKGTPAFREVYPPGINPVLETSTVVVEESDFVKLNDGGIESAARYIRAQMQREAYVPRTWRNHPLHISPVDPFSWNHPSTHACLNWIFFISSLNFSFWSELEGQPGRYGVEWRDGWGSDRRAIHTGYWSLVAAVDRALDEGIPITDPTFYASETRCPDSMIEHVFRPAAQCAEGIPLLKERIAVLRTVGAILCDFGGSFAGFVEAFRKRHNDRGTALQLVKMVADTFPSFRDEHTYNGRRVYIWKRAQILVAETWAAFYPEDPSTPHPLFPSGAAIHELTMFADYRVPQILHHLRILSYTPALIKLLHSRTLLPSGSAEELSIRAASIVGVDRVRREILRIIAASPSSQREKAGEPGDESDDETGSNQAEDAVSSVMLDFYLWDLAKRVEGQPGGVEGVETVPMLPIHRTRSIWY